MDKTATPEQIAELRAQFGLRLAAGALGSPHPADLERVRDDSWLRRFLEHQECDQKLALQMLEETVAWRKAFGTNDLCDGNVSAEYLREGLFYPRGRDVDDCAIFIFKSKKHFKGQRDFEELKKCIVYWLERLDRIDKCRQISIFFDMADTGMSNMDMEFTKYLINMFKFYYPDFLNYILIYELPWILTAAFKVIKTLLPAKAVAKMKFITKATVKEYVPLDQAQECWGGQDDYVYSFVPEPALSAPAAAADGALKKVTFSDPGSPVQEAAHAAPGGASKISLNPDDCVLFTSDGKEMSGTFALANCHSGPISYKIKTTSPEKFRVRPSMGVLAPGAQQTISLLLLEGYQQPAAGREKFLVMCVPVKKEDLSPQELSDVWKNTSNPEMESHKLRCSYPGKKTVKNGGGAAAPAPGGGPEPDKDISQITQLVSDLKQNQRSLDLQLKSLKTIQLLNLVLTSMLLCFIVYFFRFVGGKEEGAGEFCARP